MNNKEIYNNYLSISREIPEKNPTESYLITVDVSDKDLDLVKEILGRSRLVFPVVEATLQDKSPLEVINTTP